MKVQILTPESIIFEGEADSLKVPGKDGSFQMLNNHAAIVSILAEGTLEIHTHTSEKHDYLNISAEIVKSPTDEKILQYPIKGGVLEFNNNTAIVLLD